MMSRIFGKCSTKGGTTLSLFDECCKIMTNVYGGKPAGAVSEWKPRPFKHTPRYLWTDSFGVCNYLTMYCESKDDSFLQLAIALVDDVHNRLAFERSGEKRLGSATPEHPLLGGLRIGKKAEEGYHGGDHFKGDGQYYHYLTKWMFALNRMTMVTGDAKYNDWAVELVKSVHPKFVYNRDKPRPRLYWKMKIDLSAPWTRSEGHDDPYDGYAMYKLLQSASNDPKILQAEIQDLEKIVSREYSSFDSDDLLGLGCMLMIAQLFPGEPWADTIADTCLKSLERCWGYGEMPCGLGFREFGAHIGLKCCPTSATSTEWADRLERLQQHWRGKIFERDSDITPVMFCTALCPGVVGKQFMDDHKFCAT